MVDRIEFEGVPASGGIGIGKTHILEERQDDISPEKIQEEEIQFHVDKCNRAFRKIKEEFIKLKDGTDGEVADIIDAQIESLKDPELYKKILEKIESERYEAEYAIYSTLNEYIHIMENADAEWLNERTIDLMAIRDQLIDAARNRELGGQLEPGSVVFATNVSPTTMIELSRNSIAALVMQKGGLTTHAVILAQSLDIPCVIGVEWKIRRFKNSEEVIVDGEQGLVVVRPLDSEKKKYQKRRKEKEEEAVKFLQVVKKPSETACGKKFKLQANVEFLEELPRVKTHGADGVGLLRTETILFQKTGFDVASQLDFYRKVVDASGDSDVTIRLFDAGGDKLLDDSETEANPFLGWRGIRMLLDKSELLNNQLEAIYKLSGEFKNRIKLLVPMVSCVSEVYRLKEKINEVKEKLNKEDVEFDPNLPVGVMIEVPSVAIMADKIAKEVDFFSIGTNDLTQYTLAVDRGNEKISSLYQPYHPAIWKLIQMTAGGAKKSGIPVTVCGEMASKPKAAACLLGLGIENLSMTTGALPVVKSLLCSQSLKDMRKLSGQVLDANSPEEVIALMDSFGE